MHDASPAAGTSLLFGMYDRIKQQPKARHVGDLLMLAGICTYLFLMPLGRVFSEFGGLLCLAGLAWTYLFNFRSTVFFRYPLWSLYALFMAYLAFKTVHTLDFGTSWYVLRTNLYKGFIFFPAAVESIRTRKRLMLITGLIALSALMQGMDGIFQHIYGVDALRDALPEGGRLTGSMGGGRVGNYMAMTVLPGLLLWHLLPRSLHRTARMAVVSLFMVPSLYLWVFAQARSGYLGLMAAAVLLCAMLGRLRLRYMLPPAILVCLVGFFGPERATFAHALEDIRITQIWPSALAVFKEYFWFGVGNGAYRHGTDALGLVLTWQGNVVGFPHPHNIYVQLLAETGIVGFSLFSLFTLGTGIWTALRIRTGLKTGQDHTYWFMAALLWASYFGGYLVTAISAHSFFRTWWLGTAMLILGSTVGACLAVSPGTTQDAR